MTGALFEGAVLVFVGCCFGLVCVCFFFEFSLCD